MTADGKDRTSPITGSTGCAEYIKCVRKMGMIGAERLLQDLRPTPIRFKRNIAFSSPTINSEVGDCQTSVEKPWETEKDSKQPKPKSRSRSSKNRRKTKRCPVSENAQTKIQQPEATNGHCSVRPPPSYAQDLRIACDAYRMHKPKQATEYFTKLVEREEFPADGNIELFSAYICVADAYLRQPGPLTATELSSAENFIEKARKLD